MSDSFPPMQYRRLGRTGLQVPVISLGGWLTHGGLVDDEAAAECLKTAYDAGINYFDTGEGYSSGASELLLGKAIKKYGWKQNDLVISTKIYFGQDYARDPSNPLNNKGLSRKHVIEGMGASLKRLDLPYVDVVFAHRPDRQTPIEETVRAFNHLISTGKAFYWGTSEWSAGEIADAWRVADKLGLIGPVVEQPQYNLLVRQRVEKEYQPLYNDYSLGLTVYSPLKQGILTGKYNGFAAPPPGTRLAEANNQTTISIRKTFGNEAWQKDQAVVEALKPITEELNVSLAQLLIAWVLKNPNVSSVIIGASKPGQIQENLRALAVVDKLTPEIIEKIENAANNRPVPNPL